jgi:predicted PurR-regulated permease PerM
MERPMEPTQSGLNPDRNHRGRSRIDNPAGWGSISQLGLFVILTIYALHAIKPFLLPLVLAMLVSLVLHPVQRFLRRMKLPRMLAAALTVAGLLGMLGFGAYQIAVPGSKWFESLDGRELSAKLRTTFRPMTRFGAGIREVADTVGQAATVEKPAPFDPEGRLQAPDTEHDIPPAIAAVPDPEPTPKPVVVEIRQDPLATALSELKEIGLTAATFLILVLFILAYGNRITRRIGEDDGAAPILDRMADDVSRYLFTITAINTGLGICIGLAMWALGMPNPALWGLLGMLLNYIPYVGALTGTLIVFLVAAVDFESPGLVLLVPATYLTLTSIEGNIITPMALGGRFRINPLVVIVWLIAWAAIWGIAGLLIAMPALVIFKIACENTPALHRFQRLLNS